MVTVSTMDLSRFQCYLACNVDKKPLNSADSWELG